MKRLFQIIALCAAALVATQMMGQDSGGGGGAAGAGGGASAGGDMSGGAAGTGDNGGTTTTTSPDNSGAGTGEGNTSTGEGSTTSGEGNTNGGSSEGNSTLPSGGAGDQGGTGAGGGLFGPATPGTGEGSTVVPPSTLGNFPPGFAPSFPGSTPVPEAAPTGAAAAAGAAQGAGTQAAPVTFSLPGGYGGSAPQSFTLGQGRLSKPPLTYTLSVSQGYDDNIFSAPSHTTPGPTPIPLPTPPLQEEIVGFRINPPSPPTPIINSFRAKASPTPNTAGAPLGVVGSAESTATLGIQLQKGSPRTVVTMDLSLSDNHYWNRPGEKSDYAFSFDFSFLHRITPRATLTVDMFAVYQQTPNFALINAPTTNTGNNGNYLNGSGKIDLSYLWTSRISTVTSLSLNTNLTPNNDSQSLYGVTYGTQFRYALSARNTVTAELREGTSTYPSDSPADTSSTFYLLGLDTTFSARLRNTMSLGFEAHQFSNGSGSGKLDPYLESATTFSLPHQALLEWTNRYGAEDTGNSTQTETSYRTGLTLQQPLSTKLVASASVAYNVVDATGVTGSVGNSKQTQFQLTLGLNYTISPRFSINLSYTWLDLISSVANSSYTRQQIFFGGTYQFQ